MMEKGCNFVKVSAYEVCSNVLSVLFKKNFSVTDILPTSKWKFYSQLMALPLRDGCCSATLENCRGQSISLLHEYFCCGLGWGGGVEL